MRQVAHDVGAHEGTHTELPRCELGQRLAIASEQSRAIAVGAPDIPEPKEGDKENLSAFPGRALLNRVVRSAFLLCECSRGHALVDPESGLSCSLTLKCGDADLQLKADDSLCEGHAMQQKHLVCGTEKSVRALLSFNSWQWEKTHRSQLTFSASVASQRARVPANCLWLACK